MNDSDELKAWFSGQVQDNMDALYGVARRLTGSRPAAEDLVADSVVRAWRAAANLEDRSRFRPWMFRILRNTWISDCRRRSARPPETAVPDPFAEGNGDIGGWLCEQPEEFLAWWANPERTFMNSLLGEQIMAAIGRLPEAFRDTILLINVEGLTYDEAAEALGVPKGTVRSRMKRGRTLLQKALWLQAAEAGLTGP